MAKHRTITNKTTVKAINAPAIAPYNSEELSFITLVTCAFVATVVTESSIDSEFVDFDIVSVTVTGLL